MSRFSRHVLPALVLLGLLTGPGASASEPSVVIRTLAGESHTADRALSLDAQQLRFATGESTTSIPRADILTMRLVPRPHFEEETDQVDVTLLYGDRVGGRLHAIDETELTLAPRCRTGDEVLWKIPLELIRSIASIAYRPKLDKTRAEGANEPAAGDRIRLLNGDLLRGDLLAVNSERIQLRVGTTDSEILWSNIAELTFNPDLGVAPDLPATRTRLGLSDGSVLTLSAIAISPDGVVSGDAPFEPELTLRLDAIESITFLSPRVVPLSDLTPAKLESTPLLQTVFEPRRDRSVLQTPLMLKGRRYLSGWGLHSRTTIAFPLEGRYVRMIATLGIDDAAQGRGNAIAHIKTDRDSKPFELSSASSPTPIALDLTDAKELQLVVDFGRDGSVGDFVDFGDAFLVTAEPETPADPPPPRRD